MEPKQSLDFLDFDFEGVASGIASSRSADHMACSSRRSGVPELRRNCCLPRPLYSDDMEGGGEWGGRQKDSCILAPRSMSLYYYWRDWMPHLLSWKSVPVKLTVYEFSITF